MKRMMLPMLLLALLLTLPASAETADFSELYPDKFLPAGSAPIVTETSYQSADVNLTITQSRVNKSDTYVVDIYVRDVACFQRAFAGKWGRATERVNKLGAANNAIVAMTGDSAHYLKVGWVIANGEVVRDTRNRLRDLGILYADGRFVTLFNEEVDNDLLRAQSDAGEIWHIFLFGPALMDAEGHALTDFSESNVKVANPRSVIGYFAPGHYCFVQVDGRGAKSKIQPKNSSVGMTLQQLAAFMEELGCVSAYNLDGGTSSMLAYQGELISTPNDGGRKVGDIVLIKDLYTVAPTEETAEGAPVPTPNP